MGVNSKLFKYVVNEESFPDKALVIQEGNLGNWVYLLLEGKIKIQKNSPKGRLNLATLSPGAIFGELIFLQMREGHRTATAVADGPVTLGVLDMELLSKEYRSVSPLLKVLISNLARRLQESTEKLVSLAETIPHRPARSKSARSRQDPSPGRQTRG